MAEPTDWELIEAARRGEREALSALLARHQPRVWRFGMRMCRNPDDAADVLQDTLLAMARTVRDFRGASSVSTWLYSVARSFCIKKRRKARSAPHVEEPLDAAPESRHDRVPDPGRGPDEELARRQVEEALDAAIRSLSPAYREVMVLRDVEGLTAREVGEVMGLSVEAVKSRLHRARLAVRDKVAPALGVGVEKPLAGCPDVLPLLSRHLEGDISADACAQMERHVEGCSRCRGACDSLRSTLAMCRGAPSPQVPEAVQESVRAALKRVLSQSV